MKTIFTLFTKLWKIRIIYRSFVLMIFLSLTGDLTGQDLWELCSNEVPDSPRNQVDTFYTSPIYGHIDVVVTLSISDETCFNANDGKLQVLRIVEDGVVKSLDDFSFFIYKKGATLQIPIDASIDNLEDGEYILLVGSHLYEFNSIEFEIRGESTVPTVVINVERLKHETCPGASDGEVIIEVDSKNLHDVQLFWENQILIAYSSYNGKYFYRKAGLSSGKYNVSLETPYLNHNCCLNKEVKVGSNACPNSIYEFDGSVSNDWYVQPSNAVQSNNNMIFFKSDGCVFIPFHIEDVDLAFFYINAFFIGNGLLDVLDANSMTIIDGIQLEGEGSGVLIIRDVITNDFYLKFQMEKGSSIYGMKVETYEEPTPFGFYFFASGSVDSKRIVIDQQVCIGDTILPFDGFGLEGGITPYTANWAFDGDLIFDDADSLFVPISFSKEGTDNYALKIEDHLGSSDTLIFNFDVEMPESFTIEVPQLDFHSDSSSGITICRDSPVFNILTNSTNAVLSSNSSALEGSTFNPSNASAGLHYVLASGSGCDTSALLVLNIIDKQNVELIGPTSIMVCEGVVNLANYLSSSLSGLWQLDNVNLQDEMLDVSNLSIGTHSLSFLSGVGECIDTSSISIEINVGPVAEFLPIPDTFSNLSFIDLNSFLTDDSTLGGTWSGGSYITGSMFDPTGLLPGDYPIIYTVGEGPCQVSIQSTLTIQMSTSVDKLLMDKDVNITPNPVLSNFELCIEEGRLPNTIDLVIIDLNGRQVLSQNIIRDCENVDLSSVESGVYLLCLMSERRRIYVERIIKM